MTPFTLFASIDQSRNRYGLRSATGGIKAAAFCNDTLMAAYGMKDYIENTDITFRTSEVTDKLITLYCTARAELVSRSIAMGEEASIESIENNIEGTFQNIMKGSYSGGRL